MSVFTYNNISWNLPLMFCHDELIFVLAEIFEAFKDEKKPTIYTYGAMSSPWSGGRSSNIKIYDKRFLESHLTKIINAGFIPTFTFTKPVVKNSSLDDKMANWILDWGVEHNCEFIVCAENLYNHIMERHPNAKLVASILQGKVEFHNPKKRVLHTVDSELEFYNDKIDKYHRVVVRPEYNFEKLEHDSPRIKDISKLEILLNETCVPNCPFARGCYSSMDTISNKRKEPLCGRDEFKKRNDIKAGFSFTLLVRKEQIDRFINIGVKHLKVQGRHYNSGYLFNLILYFLFNTDGEFQSVLPYIFEKLKKHKSEGKIMSYEQYVTKNQYLRTSSLDLL